jgi:hypothetical protein
MERPKKVKIFHSFEEENEAEYRRRAEMTPEERLAEFAVLQERTWGKDWTSKPMLRVATWEDVDWYP